MTKKPKLFEKYWDKPKLQKIMEFRTKGWTTRQIAEYFNRSEAAVRKVIERAGIPNIQKRAKKKGVTVKWTQKRIAELYDLLVLKKYDTERVALEMQFPKKEVKQMASKLGFYSTLRDSRNVPMIQSIRKDKRKGDKVARDLATRVMELRGDKGSKLGEWIDFADEQILSWLEGVEGFNHFCKEVLGVTLQDYQITIAKTVLSNKRTALVLGRQVGKDFTISCLAIWLCVCHSNEKILLVSPAQRQSDMLYKRILTFIATVPELDHSVQRQTAEFTIFQNGSELYTLPSTSYIRGYTEVTWIFVNEAAYAPDECFSALEPMLSIKDGNMVLMSTPAGCQGYLWEAFNNPIWATMQLPSNINKYIKPNWFVSQKERMRPEEYDTEINAHFSQVLSNFFPPDLVDKCSREYDYKEFPENGWVYYCGVDWGRVHDSSVITVLGKRLVDKELQVVNVKELKRVSFPEQIVLIQKLHERFNFHNIIVEYAGLGIPASEDLKNRGLPVKFFTPSLQEKESAYNYLLKVMEGGKLTINSNDRKLQYEIKMFRYEITRYGKMKLHHMAGGSDDFVDSLCFSVLASKEKRIWFGIR